MLKHFFMLAAISFGTLLQGGPNLEMTAEEQSPQWSAPFTVLDQPKGVYGEYRRADDAFHAAAARGALRLLKNGLEVRFNCPIPDKMSLSSGSSTPKEKGECVEFFFSPGAALFPYYHYTVNANGKKNAKKYSAVGVETAGWRSQFESEVKRSEKLYEVVMRIPYSELGIGRPEAGMLFRGNLARSGKTAGGLSVWAPVGRNFHSPALFGNFVAESFGALLNTRLQSAEQRFSAIRGGSPDVRKTVECRIAVIKKSIEDFGRDPAFFPGLEKSLSRIELDLASLEYGDSLLVWQIMPWNNDFTLQKGTSPLKEIKLTVPEGGDVYFGFALTNFSDSSYLGRIKWFSKYNKHSFNGDSNAPDAARVELYEMLELCNLNHLPIYDPLIPLPLGSVVRVPSGDTIPLLMRVNAKGWKPGTYSGKLAVKSSLPEFKTTLIPLEITVSKVNISGFERTVPYYSYTFNPWNKEKSHEIMKLYAKYDADTILMQHPGRNTLSRVWPEIGADGNAILSTIDLSQFDSVIDRAILAGFPKERLKIFIDFTDCFFLRKGKQPGFAIESESFEKALRETLDIWFAHFKKKYGVPLERIYLLPVDEAGGDIDDPKSRVAKSLAYAKVLKKINPNFRLFANSTMTYNTPKATVLKNMRAQSQYYDIFCPLLWFFFPEIQDIWRGKELWSYLVLDNNTPPYIYRRMFWLNYRYGMAPAALFWHMEEHAGGDGLEFFTGWANGIRTNYGIVYTDIAHGKILSSRRLEAHFLGAQDYKLMEFCRQKLLEKTDLELSRQLEKIVKEGSGSSDMSGILAAQEKLFALAQRLEKR